MVPLLVKKSMIFKKNVSKGGLNKKNRFPGSNTQTNSNLSVKSSLAIGRRNPNLTPLKKHVFEVSTVLESSDALLIRSG